MKTVLFFLFRLSPLALLITPVELEKHISTLLENQEITEYFGSQKEFVIIPTSICNELNCNPQNIDSVKELKFYSKEETFLRNAKFITILNISKSNNQIHFLISWRGKGQKVISISK